MSQMVTVVIESDPLTGEFNLSRALVHQDPGGREDRRAPPYPVAGPGWALVSAQRLMDSILVSPEAKDAYLGKGVHKDSAWFRAAVDMLRSHERHGGDFIDGIRDILVAVNRHMAKEVRDRITEHMLRVDRQVIGPDGRL